MTLALVDPDTTWQVHRAGPVTDGVQSCTACGQVLLDQRLAPWPPGRGPAYARGQLVARLGDVVTAPAPPGRLPATDFQPCTAPTPKDRR